MPAKTRWVILFALVLVALVLVASALAQSGGGKGQGSAAVPPAETPQPFSAEVQEHLDNASDYFIAGELGLALVELDQASAIGPDKNRTRIEQTRTVVTRAATATEYTRRVEVAQADERATALARPTATAIPPAATPPPSTATARPAATVLVPATAVPTTGRPADIPFFRQTRTTWDDFKDYGPRLGLLMNKADENDRRFQEVALKVTAPATLIEMSDTARGFTHDLRTQAGSLTVPTVGGPLKDAVVEALGQREDQYVKSALYLKRPSDAAWSAYQDARNSVDPSNARVGDALTNLCGRMARTMAECSQVFVRGQ